MAAGAPVAGAAAAEGALGTAGIAAYLTFLVCMGLAVAWRKTFGAVFLWAGDRIDGLPQVSVLGKHVPPWGRLADLFRAISHNTEHYLAVAALNASHAATWSFNKMAATFWWSVHETEALSRALLSTNRTLVTVTLPHFAATAVRHGAADTAAALRKLRSSEAAALRSIRHSVASVRVHAAHAVATADHALGWGRAQAGRFERRLDRQARRLDALRKHFATAAFAGLVAAALTRLGLKWLRCSNTKRAAKAACGMDADLLDALIAGTVVVAGTVSFVEFVEDCVDLSDEVFGTLFGLVREV